MSSSQTCAGVQIQRAASSTDFCCVPGLSAGGGWQFSMVWVCRGWCQSGPLDVVWIARSFLHDLQGPCCRLCLPTGANSREDALCSSISPCTLHPQTIAPLANVSGSSSDAAALRPEQLHDCILTASSPPRTCPRPSPVGTDRAVIDDRQRPDAHLTSVHVLPSCFQASARCMPHNQTP